MINNIETGHILVSIYYRFPHHEYKRKINNHILDIRINNRRFRR